ncbi:MAG: Mur ligase family protein, partial [Thermaerobacterales bacterium]
VGGTNGKGSVCAHLAAVFHAAGLHALRFVSPHIMDVRESFQYAAGCISRQVLAELTRELRGAAVGAERRCGELPTQFECLAALAFLWAVREAADVLVLEVGLGGRGDATNAARRVDVSVITNVTADHTDILGDDPDIRAAEKAGIIRLRVPVVTGADGGALEIIRARAAALAAPVITVAPAAALPVYGISDPAVATAGTKFVLSRPDGSRTPLQTSLPGRHQALNAALAVAACEQVAPFGADREPDRGAVAAGLAQVRWPGRNEILLGAGAAVMIDAAHNPAAMEALVLTVESLFSGRPIILVCGMLRDKDLEGSVRPWRGRVRRVITVSTPGPRGLPADTLAGSFRAQGEMQVTSCGDWRAGLRQALAEAAGSDSVVCCCGSLYLTVPARSYLIRMGLVSRNVRGEGLPL